MREGWEYTQQTCNIPEISPSGSSQKYPQNTNTKIMWRRSNPKKLISNSRGDPSFRRHRPCPAEFWEMFIKTMHTGHIEYIYLMEWRSHKSVGLWSTLPWTWSEINYTRTTDTKNKVPYVEDLSHDPAACSVCFHCLTLATARKGSLIPNEYQPLSFKHSAAKSSNFALLKFAIRTA